MTKNRSDPIEELRRTGATLPRRVAPLPGELVSSYIRRLAEANLLNAADLHITIAGSRRVKAEPRIEVLERLSGYSEKSLRHALPELSQDREQWPLLRQNPGCTLCGAVRGAARPFRLWRRGPEDVLCRQHSRWITGGEYGWAEDEQLSVAEQPEILKAHRLHLRLIRRHGRHNTTVGFNQATWILDQWRTTNAYDYYGTKGFDQRVSTFLGPDWQQLIVGSTVTVAARYPQQVALARLLVTPFWKELALKDHIQLGHPRLEDRQNAANAIYEYRRTTGIFENIPIELARALAATYLLLDGPNLRKFLNELRRTVEPRYKWNPLPRRFLSGDLLGNDEFDPLVDWVQEQIHERLHPGPSHWEHLLESLRQESN
ncbi:hypothetical protein AB4305_32945 [Nocardia sp. 2YAB30]|uniref:hypothetical protein n=1 Tax=Nocardia sp. 2YAB30 TaxID=3233022 RepID=UPI003F9AE196